MHPRRRKAARWRNRVGLQYPVWLLRNNDGRRNRSANDGSTKDNIYNEHLHGTVTLLGPVLQREYAESEGKKRIV